MVVVPVVGVRGGTSLTRLPLWRQPALHSAALRLGLPLGARAIDDLLLFVDAYHEVAKDLVHHPETAIQLLHQFAGSVDHLEDVDALLVMSDFIRQLAASPRFRLLDLPVHPQHDRLNLLMELGHLLFGGIGGEDVDELVLSTCHMCSSRTRRWIADPHARGGRPQADPRLCAPRAIPLSPDRRRCTRSSRRRSLT